MAYKSFSLSYFLLLLFIVLVIVGITYLLRNKDEKTKTNFLLGFCIFNTLLFIVYKIILASNTIGLPDDYKFELVLELPIHLCNISLFLVPIGLLKKNNMLLAYGFYIAPLGAFFALTFPSKTFVGLNPFYLHMMGFIGTHANIVIIGILLVSLKIFKPVFKQIPMMYLFIMPVSIIIFLLNVILRKRTGSAVNYFYSYEPEGISILEAFWKLIPVRYLYLLPALVILAGYASLTTLPFYLVEKHKNKKENTISQTE